MLIRNTSLKSTSEIIIKKKLRITWKSRGRSNWECEKTIFWEQYSPKPCELSQSPSYRNKTTVVFVGSKNSYTHVARTQVHAIDTKVYYWLARSSVMPEKHSINSSGSTRRNKQLCPLNGEQFIQYCTDAVQWKLLLPPTTELLRRLLSQRLGNDTLTTNVCSNLNSESICQSTVQRSWLT